MFQDYFVTVQIKLFNSSLNEKSMCKNLMPEVTRNKNHRRQDSILAYPLWGFNNNITTTRFHHSSENSTILKKKYESKDFFKKALNMPDITARPDSNRLHATTNSLQSVTSGRVGCENPNFWY